MKTVGIITMHNVLNYGSLLQAYATQCIFEKLGYKSTIIDYAYPNNFHFDHGYPSKRRGKRKITGIRSFCLWVQETFHIGKNERKRSAFKEFKSKYLTFTKPYETYESLIDDPPIFDVYCAGSDQIWNPRFSRCDSNYFLGFAPSGRKKISFSSSFSQSSISDEQKELILPFLNELNAVSLREQNGVDLYHEMTHKQASLTLDPTLMLDRNEWKRFVHDDKDDKGYILLYVLDYAFEPKPYIYDVLEHFRKKYNLSVVDLKPIKGYGRNSINAHQSSPEEFLKLFANASLVITSSFHGTAFAANFGKPLIAVVPSENKDDRQVSLLKQLHIENCIVRVGDDIPNIDPFYDEEEEQKQLEVLRKRSYDYVVDALK